MVAPHDPYRAVIRRHWPEPEDGDGADPADIRVSADPRDWQAAYQWEPMLAGPGMGKPVRWLWRGWLPRGTVALLAAPGGTGKGSLAVEFGLCTVGALTTWPDGQATGEPGDVLLLAFEDALEYTVLPRVHAYIGDAMAEPEAGSYGRSAYADGLDAVAARERDPERDPLAILYEMRQATGRAPSLIVIDPLVNMTAAFDLDENSNGDMGFLIGRLAELAKAWDCCVLLCHHTRKGEGGSADEASRGASAINNAARTQLRLIRGRDDQPDVRMLGRPKANLGPDKGIIHYEMRVHRYRNSAGEAIEAAALHPTAYDPDSTIAVELARGADGATVTDGERRRQALEDYIAAHGPIETGDLALAFADLTEDQLKYALGVLRRSGRVTRRGLTKAAAEELGVEWKRGRYSWETPAREAGDDG